MPQHQHICEVCIKGMTCRSCEISIERKWKTLDGVRRVEVDTGTGQARLFLEGEAPTLLQLQEALGHGRYRVLSGHENVSAKRPSFWQLVGLFVFVLVLGVILSKIGLFKTSLSFERGASFWTVFVIGLVAASSSCIAVSGGLLLSSAAVFNERYGSVSRVARLRPVALFIVGRIISYTVLGGVIGFIGKALSPPPLVTGIIAIIAALYMLIMGLEMLHLAPQWLKRLMPSMPKGLSHRVLDAERKEHWAAPFLLGGATFFLPCGFTQALQLYALTTGSVWTSATLLSAFALGTAPALLALGWASTSLRGRLGRLFFQFSGALVIVLGVWNIQNGFAITGHPLTWPSIGGRQITALVGGFSSANGVSFDGQTQIMTMSVNNNGYSPNQFTIRAGMPTRWVIDGTHAGGCISVLVSPSLGVQKLLAAGQNTIEFTAPSTPGVYPFSCSMGMYRGQIRVVSSS